MNQHFQLPAYLKIAVEKMLSYLKESNEGKDKVLQQRPAQDLAKELQLNYWIKNGGISPTDFSKIMDVYLENTQHMHHPRYIGHQVSVPHPMAGVSGLINGISNNPMGIYEMGPAAATMERTVINWLLDKVGWFKGAHWSDFSWIEGNGGGVLTNGGSMANLTALSAARSAIAPKAWDEGSPKDLVVLVPAVAHYSIARAISIMGMGKNSVIPVDVDSNERLRPEALLPVYEQVKSAGKRVMAIVANACATSTGLYDPLDEVGHFCETNNLWYHVDGAHGAAALVSPEESGLMKGINRANSMIWDAHKMLQVNALCAAILYKDQQHMGAAFQQKGAYLFHEKEQPGFDLMPYTVECTKSGLGAKLFWTLAAEGEKGMGEFVHLQYQKTKEFHQVFSTHPDFYCPYFPESNILCFAYTKYGEDNDLQLAIRNEVTKRGHFYISSTEVHGRRYLRLTVMNKLTTNAHIEALIQEIILVGKIITTPHPTFS